MKKRSKYNNKKVRTLHGLFDSKGEFERWLFLLDCQKRGMIEGLRRQVEFPLAADGHHICDYRADFTYYKDGNYIIEDFKGMITDIFKLKAKLFIVNYGKEIKIVKSPTAET